DVEAAEREAPRGPAGRAGLLLERDRGGQLHRSLEDLPPAAHGEPDLLPGTPREEQPSEGARAVHGGAVEGQEPVAGTEPDPGRRTVLNHVVEDRAILAIPVAQAGA